MKKLIDSEGNAETSRATSECIIMIELINLNFDALVTKYIKIAEFNDVKANSVDFVEVSNS